MSATIPCILCGMSGDTLYVSQPDHLRGIPGVWDLLECESCALLWLDPMPLEDEVGLLYEGYYPASTGSAQSDRIPICRPDPRSGWRAVIRKVWPTPGRRRKADRAGLFETGDWPPGRVLEVGCGRGQNLVRLRDAGWEVVGQEIDANGAAIAAARGIEVHAESIENVDLAPSSFDLLIVNHVIEHMRDPMRDMRAASRLLKAGGRLVCVTPNARSMAHRMFRSNWFDLDTPRHLFLYSESSLGVVLRSAGFANIAVRTRDLTDEFIAKESTRRMLRRWSPRPRWVAGCVVGIVTRVASTTTRFEHRGLSAELVATGTRI